MPLTYAEYDAKRNEFLYWAEYGRTVKPTLNYLARGMYAAAEKLETQHPEQAQNFRKMGDAMIAVTGEIDLGATRNEIAEGLETVNGLYPFLQQTTGGVPNRDLLKQALADHPELRNEYLTTDETRNTSFEQQLDNIGDFFVISQRAIDEQVEQIRREKVIHSREVRREQERERIEKLLKTLPEEQRAAEEERLWNEFNQQEELLSKGAEYAQQQDEERQRREKEEHQRAEENRRLQQEELRRAEELRQKQEQERLRQKQEQQKQQQQKDTLRQQLADLRSRSGPLQMPRGYDYRDAAIHFTRSLQKGKPEDSAVFKTAEKIHAKRQAMEKEVEDIVAGVDKRMPPDAGGDCLDTIRKVSDRTGPLVNHYGRNHLRENLERMPGNREEQEIRLYAEMKKEQLVTEARRGDLLKRFPERKALNAQLEPHRATARRQILEKHFGKDLEKRRRQTKNELTASTLLSKFFLAPEQKANLAKLLQDTYKDALPQKLAACEDRQHPEHELFRKEIFEPALRSTKKWKELGNAMGFPKEIYSQLITDMDTLTMVMQNTIRPEAVEKSLFEDLTELHPEQPLENLVEQAAEKSLYASLHKDEPQPEGDKLLYQWARDLETKIALEGKQEKLEEMRRLDEAADGLKKACLKGDLTDASRQMKATMTGLYPLAQNDPELFRELAGDLDKEWAEMDLLESKKLREEQKIPEQYLPRKNEPAPAKPNWPFKDKQVGEKLSKQPVREYRYHAFDKDFLDEKWSEEKLNEEELELNLPGDEDTLVENDILANLPTPVAEFIDKEWDHLEKLGKRERKPQEEIQKCLSRIVAADTLQLQGKDDPPEQEINALADKLRKNGALKQVAAFVDPALLAKGRRTDLILKCMEKETAAQTQSRRARQQRLQKELGPVVNKLLATGKGKSYFFGIPRFLTGNSSRYENALAAMQEVQRSKSADPAVVGPAVDTVKEYLRDKMEVRDREFGRVRWEQCMTFLKHTMPREEFQRYCLEVNRARGSLNPAHKDHVAAEMFGTPQTVKEMREDILTRIRAGEGSRHDYAVLGAMKAMNLEPEAQPDLKALLVKAGNIEGSAAFGLVMANASPGLLLRMAEKDDGEALSRCEEFSQELYKGAANSLPGLEEPMGLEKEMLEIASEGRDLKKVYEEIKRRESLMEKKEPGEKQPAEEKEQEQERELGNESILSY